MCVKSRGRPIPGQTSTNGDSLLSTEKRVPTGGRLPPVAALQIRYSPQDMKEVLWIPSHSSYFFSVHIFLNMKPH